MKRSLSVRMPSEISISPSLLVSAAERQGGGAEALEQEHEGADGVGDIGSAVSVGIGATELRYGDVGDDLFEQLWKDRLPVLSAPVLDGLAASKKANHESECPIARALPAASATVLSTTKRQTVAGFSSGPLTGGRQRFVKPGGIQRGALFQVKHRGVRHDRR